MKIRITAVLFVVLALTFCFGSCSESMSDAEAAAILTELVPRSQQLNAVFWGDALPLADENAEPVLTVTTAQYYPVADDSPYRSVAQIKAEAEQIFSPDYLEDIYAMAFDGYAYTDDDGNEFKIEPRFKDDEDGVLAMDITYQTYNFRTEIDTSTAKIIERGSGIVKVKVNCIVDGKQSDMTVTLKEGEDGVWLIDSPTY